MKYLTSLLVLATLVFGSLNSQTKQTPADKGKAAGVETTVIKVPTVVCSSCVSTITKALKKVDGVKTTTIDLKKKTATVTFASAKTSVNKIETAIAKAGYDANNVKRDPAAYEKLGECCKVDAKE